MIFDSSIQGESSEAAYRHRCSPDHKCEVAKILLTKIICAAKSPLQASKLLTVTFTPCQYILKVTIFQQKFSGHRFLLTKSCSENPYVLNLCYRYYYISLLDFKCICLGNSLIIFNMPYDIWWICWQQFINPVTYLKSKVSCTPLSVQISYLVSNQHLYESLHSIIQNWK